MNPYAPPSTSDFEALKRPSLAQSGLTEKMLEDVRAARPWVKFFAVLWLVFAALLVITGAVTLIFGSFSQRTPAWLGLLYIPFAALYVVPGVLCWRFASRLGDVVAMPSTGALEGVLAANRSLWRTTGRMAAGLVGLYLAVIAGGFVFGIVSMLVRAR